ncbi:hypothetical protein JTL80_36120, partial [Pseudomonas aeruginosa]|nr:hypothetical protein [Pseudomonas aeruginosa]
IEIIGITRKHEVFHLAFVQLGGQVIVVSKTDRGLSLNRVEIAIWFFSAKPCLLETDHAWRTLRERHDAAAFEGQAKKA